jgi:hypothetical protein
MLDRTPARHDDDIWTYRAMARREGDNVCAPRTGPCGGNFAGAQGPDGAQRRWPVLVAGEAGSGKTALVRSVATYATVSELDE